VSASLACSSHEGSRRYGQRLQAVALSLLVCACWCCTQPLCSPTPALCSRALPADHAVRNDGAAARVDSETHKNLRFHQINAAVDGCLERDCNPANGFTRRARAALPRSPSSGLPCFMSVYGLNKWLNLILYLYSTWLHACNTTYVPTPSAAHKSAACNQTSAAAAGTAMAWFVSTIGSIGAWGTPIRV